MKKIKRRKWPLRKKFKIIREKKCDITVKKICQKYDIAPSQFYRWKREHPEWKQ